MRRSWTRDRLTPAPLYPGPVHCSLLTAEADASADFAYLLTERRHMDSLSDFDEEPSPYPKNITAKEEFCAPTEEEIKALRRLDRKEPLKIKVEKELDDCTKNGGIWRQRKRRNRQRLWRN